VLIFCRADLLYAFLVQWSPIYVQEGDDSLSSEKGFVVIDHHADGGTTAAEKWEGIRSRDFKSWQVRTLMCDVCNVSESLLCIHEFVSFTVNEMAKLVS